MQQPPKLIAIHGLKGSGKDLTAKMLRKYAINSDTFAFADKLKKVCSVAWGVPIDHFYSDTLKEVEVRGTGMSPRTMMTSLSDVIKGRYGEGFFVDEVAYRWREALQDRRHLIVTDLRFPFEAARLRDLGAIVIHVERPGNTLYSASTHASEHGLHKRDHDPVIDNSRDKAYLMQQVRNIVRIIWGEAALHSYPFNPTEVVEF